MTQAFVLVTVALAVAVPLLVVLKRLAHPDWSQPLQLMRLQSEEAATRMRQLREEISVSIKAVGDSIAKSLYVSPSAGTPATVETELTTLTEANRTSAMQLREEIAVSSQALTDSLVRSMNEIVETQQNQLAVLGRHLLALAKTTEEKLDELRGAVEMRLSASPEASVTLDRPTECNPLKREDLATGLRALNDSIESNLNEIAVLQKNEFDGVAEHLRALADANEKNVDGMRSVAEEQSRRMQEDSAVKIDQFCVAVDEKLRRTLERGLGDSLQPVSDRLEQIYEGIGEIRALAAGSDDEIRTPVDTRPEGAWEEVYLGDLLGRVLPPEQFEPRVVTRKGSGERVEFAVRLPARDEDGQDPTWLPIASCPPEAATGGLEATIETAAQRMNEQHLNPPTTTNFGILFMPSEGLFAEVVCRAGLAEYVQREYRIVLAGPSTLAALLQSLEWGYRTAATQKAHRVGRSILDAITSEVGTIGGILGEVKNQLANASDAIDAIVRKRRPNAQLIGEEDPSGSRAVALGSEVPAPRLLVARGGS